MNWLPHILGIDDVSGRWYAFWSGAGADLSELAIVGALIGFGGRLFRRHILPHLHLHAEHIAAEVEHRADMRAEVRAEFDALHDRLDEISPPVDPDQGGKHGVDSQTGTFPPVPEPDADREGKT